MGKWSRSTHRSWCASRGDSANIVNLSDEISVCAVTHLVRARSGVQEREKPSLESRANDRGLCGSLTSTCCRDGRACSIPVPLRVRQRCAVSRLVHDPGALSVLVGRRQLRGSRAGHAASGRLAWSPRHRLSPRVTVGGLGRGALGKWLLPCPPREDDHDGGGVPSGRRRSHALLRRRGR